MAFPTKTESLIYAVNNETYIIKFVSSISCKGNLLPYVTRVYHRKLVVDSLGNIHYVSHLVLKVSPLERMSVGKAIEYCRKCKFTKKLSSDGLPF